MKYAWIERHRRVWPISIQCEVLGVSPSGYHGHLRQSANPRTGRRIGSDALLVHVKAIHAEVKAEYGWPRIWKELLDRGIPVGKERVRRLMAGAAWHQGSDEAQVQGDDGFEARAAGGPQPARTAVRGQRTQPGLDG